MFEVIFGLWFEQFELNLYLVAEKPQEKPLRKGENREKKNTENKMFSNIFFCSLNSQKTRKTTFSLFSKRSHFENTGNNKNKNYFLYQISF